MGISLHPATIGAAMRFPPSSPQCAAVTLRASRAGTLGVMLSALCTLWTMTGAIGACGGARPVDAEIDHAGSPKPIDAGVDRSPQSSIRDAEVDPRGPPYPILLVHGMAGFDKSSGGPAHYFNGVVDDLATHGETSVFAVVLSPYDASEVRARELAHQLDEALRRTGKAKVNIIGHSQGGLDARLLASPAGLGYGDRIASITTIATPHRGSRLADVTLKMIEPFGSFTFDGISSAWLKVVQRAFYEISADAHLRAQLVEISEHHMTSVFNPRYTDDPRVAYFSYAGRSNGGRGLPDCNDGLYPDDPTKVDDGAVALRLTASFLEGGLGKANDGMVTVQSAKWGAFLQCVPADHFSEVGQPNLVAPNPRSGFFHLEFFRLIVARIRDRAM
ncbi:MAG: alpha/beta fold hydrolase [Polyangiales bacterium]